VRAAVIERVTYYDTTYEINVGGQLVGIYYREGEAKAFARGWNAAVTRNESSVV